ncbi:MULTISPECIES: branched-chain amino acid ABC transporter permease [unclassified Caballeronia]|uniref:branched-chain amino acid ABC transporter permease n=1 Tax=unclassified Caballeronia TaxID=2646786 RepID=UPI0020294AE8|nr:MULTISPECIES: branched-chain amino acid ABC transporter permease [unclassified Caballeronia]
MFSPAVLGQVFVDGIGLSAIYILIALGFTLLFGIMRVVNFAHGAFAMLGGYALYYLYGGFGLPYLIAAPLSALIVAIVALLLERIVYRFFYQRMFQSMIGLLGLDMAIMYTAVIVWNAEERSVPPSTDALLQIGGLVFPAQKLIIIGIAAVALLTFYVFTHYSRYGLAMRAAAQDVDIAEAQGVNSTAIYRLAFFIAIFMAALAGGFYAQTYALSPFVGEPQLMIAFIVVILGGMGSIPGVALGGLLLGLANSFLGTFYGSAMSIFVSFGAVILLLIFRPWGLLGAKEA